MQTMPCEPNSDTCFFFSTAHKIIMFFIFLNGYISSHIIASIIASWLVTPKIFTNWPFQKKFADPCPKTFTVCYLLISLLCSYNGSG